MKIYTLYINPDQVKNMDMHQRYIISYYGFVGFRLQKTNHTYYKLIKQELDDADIKYTVSIN